MKSSICGVMQHDAPKSIIACDVYFLHVFVAISTDILRSSLFCMVDLFAGVSHLAHQMLRHVDTYVEC
jgi:hypothetical protein